MTDPRNMTPEDLQAIRHALDKLTTDDEKKRDINALLGLAEYQTTDIAKLKATGAYLLALMADLEKEIERLEAELAAYRAGQAGARQG